MIGKPPFVSVEPPSGPFTRKRGRRSVARSGAALSRHCRRREACFVGGDPLSPSPGNENAVFLRADDPAEIELVRREVEPLRGLQVDPACLAAPHAPDLAGLSKLADCLLEELLRPATSGIVGTSQDDEALLRPAAVAPEEVEHLVGEGR